MRARSPRRSTELLDVSWADAQSIADAAMQSMGMDSATDPDSDAVLVAANTALELLDAYMGNPDLPIPTPTPVLDAAVLVTVETYRRKDATFGVLNNWTTADFGPVRISSDWLKAVESMVHPWMRASFGIG
jgi:hypothetical protein